MMGPLPVDLRIDVRRAQELQALSAVNRRYSRLPLNFAFPQIYPAEVFHS